MYLLVAVISQELVIYLYADSASNAFNGNSHGWRGAGGAGGNLLTDGANLLRMKRKKK